MGQQGFSPSSAGIAYPQCAWANLPDPVANPGLAFFCPDAGGGPSNVISNGTTWNVFAIGVQRMSKQTDASGNAVFTWAPKFAVTPVPAPSVVQDAGRQLIWNITNQDANGMTVNVRRSSALPGTILTLAALVGFDPFAGLAAAGIIVNVWAAPPTQVG